MKTFLEYVAQDVLEKYGTNLSRIVIVFPNKRASLFFNEYLAKLAQRPIWSPAYMTISELFRAHSTLQVADPIKLICDLYKCFVKETGVNETLDHFYGWGQLMLADFDDIDKNMAEADKVFANLRNLHELDDVSYLTDDQKAIIRKFFSNFSTEQNSELKQRFLNLWSHFGGIYHSYNTLLRQQGLAYEGALYREVATNADIDYEYEQYLFVGFNLLQKVEQRLFQRLQKQQKARFYWDFDHYYMSDNEAGYYISQYLDKFPNELDNKSDEIYKNFIKPKQLTYCTATTENIQARFMAEWLQKHGRIEAGRRTAIVLCDESLLPMAIHCLPDEVEKVNITTGYPLVQSPVSSLLMQLFALQTAGYVEKSDRFRLQYINKVLRHPYAQYISERCQELYKTLNTAHIYYPSREQLELDESLSLLFSLQEGERTIQICNWLIKLLKLIAVNSQRTNPDKEPLFAESTFRLYTLLNRLYGLMMSDDLKIDLITFHRLLTQLIQSTSVPFHGEPAEGLQVMGVLETRNLDFDHVLILSCNEGNMPRGVNDTSFIPYNLRKAFDLTTIDHKVAIYSYYFHRLLQRAHDITIVYNNATEDGKTGEMSRFMLQLMVESKHSIEQQVLQSGRHVTERKRATVNKTPEVLELLHKRFNLSYADELQQQMPLLTPSAINRYMRCPLYFYYHYVGGLSELEENDEDTIDGRIFGNIFHEAAHRIYEQLGYFVTRQPIEALLKNKIEIERAVDNAIKKELFNLKGTAKIPDLNGLQIINREVIIRYLRQLLTIDKQLESFNILGLEKPVMRSWTIEPIEGEPFTTTIGGTIDRLDSVMIEGEERIRVVDYKTGGGNPEGISNVENIFDNTKIEKHSNYYLQTFLYGLIVSGSEEYNSQHKKVSPALFFVQRSSQESYDPTLKFGKESIADVKVWKMEFEERLKGVINEIFSPSIPFKPTDEISRCVNCPFKGLCNG